MNNKKLGTAFEKMIVKELADTGAWVHFLTPDERGAQPFDIITVKNNVAIAIECKTLTTDKRYFTINRLEANQIFAFERWLSAGNASPMILVEYGDKYVWIPYVELKEKKRIDMREVTE